MANNVAFALERALATRAAQEIIAGTWVWEEKTVAQWDTQIAAFIAQKEAEQDADAAMLAQRGTLDTGLDTLHDLTRRCLALAKNRHRHDAAKLAVFERLSARSGGRQRKIQDALEWESAWEEVDAAWSPLAGVTLATFKPQRQAAEAALKSYADAEAAWKAADSLLDTLARQLLADCVAWYEAATTVFAEGTTEGDMIRSTVPTSYNPPDDPPTPLHIHSVEHVGNGDLRVTYAAGGGVRATSLTLQWKVEGVEPEFGHDTAVAQPEQTVPSGASAGETLRLRVRAANSVGTVYGNEALITV